MVVSSLKPVKSSSKRSVYRTARRRSWISMPSLLPAQTARENFGLNASGRKN